MGTTSIEDVAEASPQARKWFQLYMWRDRERSMALVERAKAAGYDTLVVTVDVPVAGARLRDTRNGMTIPPTLTPRTVLNAIPRPAWWINFLTTQPLAFASLDSWSGTVGELLDHMFDPTVTFEDLAWIRDQWPGAISVKGVQSVDDARRLADAASMPSSCRTTAADSLTGRRPFHLLPRTVEAVGGNVEIHLDTGIMSGQDIVAAVAHGAGSRSRPRLPVRADGRRSTRRGPCDRHPAWPDRANDASVGREESRRAHPEHVTMLRRLSPHAEQTRAGVPR